MSKQKKKDLELALVSKQNTQEKHPKKYQVRKSFIYKK